MSKAQDKYLKSLKDPIWCTETHFGSILDNLFGQNLVKRKQLLKIDGKIRKPDFIIELDNPVIVEFDGWQHFTKCEQAFKDLKYDDYFSILSNYKTIRLPYFIQPTKEVIKFLFKEIIRDTNFNSDFSNNFPHGFIHPKALCPGDFCFLGLFRFLKDMKSFPIEVKNQVKKSLKMRSTLSEIPLNALNPMNF